MTDSMKGKGMEMAEIKGNICGITSTTKLTESYSQYLLWGVGQ